MFVGKGETGREADRLGTVGIGGCVRSQVNGTSHKAACTRSRARQRVEERAGGACRRRSVRCRGGGGGRSSESEQRRGGHAHYILDSIVVKRGATGGQVQVHRRCRYACSMPCTTRRTPYGAIAQCSPLRDSLSTIYTIYIYMSRL